MVKLVLFDIDGTLIRTHGAGVKAFMRAFACEFGLEDGFDQLTFAGRTDTSVVRQFFRIHHIEPGPEEMERFFSRYVFLLDYYLQSSTGGVIPGVWEWLHQLQNLPHPPITGLLTGNIRLGAEIKLRHFGIWEPFVTGAFADDHEDRNEIARIAFQRGRHILGNNLKPQEVLVIGDTLHDVRCGKAIGAKTLALATGGAKIEALAQSGADWAVNNLLEIHAATVCS